TADPPGMSNNNRDRIAGALATAVQAAFETMEARRLLSTVAVADGVLVIDADPHTASNIIVDLHAPKGRIRGYCDGVQTTFAAADVKAIRVTGSDGDDKVYIDPALTLPTLIRTGAGDDRVRGGSGVDTVDAGAGPDEGARHRTATVDGRHGRAHHAPHPGRPAPHRPRDRRQRQRRQ